MRKVIKYILIIIAACGLVFILFSCKARKVTPEPEVAPVKPVAGDPGNARFGHLFVDGCAERMKGNLQDALKLFEECAVIDPSNIPVKYELGMIYKLLGDHEKAIANARIAAEADAMNEWYQMLLIECFNGAKQYSQAIKVRENLVKNFPGRVEFREELAIDYAMSGQFDRSFRIYDDMEKTFGVTEQITLNKIKLLKGQKKMKEVEKELLKLASSNKNEPRFLAYLAEFYFETNAVEKAKEMYDRILVLDPGNPTVHLALHDYYTARGNDKEAFGHLKTAFMNPDLDVATKAGIAGNFYNRATNRVPGAKEQGIELAEIMLKQHPVSPSSNALYADFLMLDKKIKEASRYYYTAASFEKRDFRIWDNLLFVDNELGRFDSLEHHSAMAIELFPNQPRNYLYNGVANTQLRNFTKAAAVLSEGIEFVVDNKSLLLDFLRLMGDAKYYVKDYAGSDKAFEEALKIDSDNTYVLNNYSYFLSQRNEQLDKAEKLSKRTLDLQPDNRNYMDTYGWILYRRGKYAEAEAWLSKAAGTGAGNSTILEHHGDALYRLNRVDEAVARWNAAKAAGGNSESLNRKIKNKKLDD